MAKPPQRKRPKTAPKGVAKRAQISATHAGDENFLQRIAAALERLAPTPEEQLDFADADDAEQREVEVERSEIRGWRLARSRYCRDRTDCRA